MITKPHRQQVLFEERFDGKIKTLTNSRSVQCSDFLDLSSFRFIYFPHRLVYYAFSYNLVNADSKKIANLISKLNFYKLIPYPMDNC